MIHPLRGPRTSSARTVPDDNNADSGDIFYELQASTTLPVIDCTKTIKHVLFHGTWLTRYNRFTRATRNVFHVSFALGLALVSATMLFDRHTNAWVAFVCAALLLPPLLISCATLRVEILALLTRTYEFWYFSTLQLLSNAVVCANVGDQRALIMVCLMLLFQYALILDASARDARAAILGSVVGALSVSVFVFAQAFRLIRDFDNVQLGAYGRWTLRATDVTVNGYSIIVVVMLRNAFRKYRSVASHDRHRAVVRCSSYRARLQFVQVAAARVTDSGVSPAPALHPARRDTTRLSKATQLRLVPWQLCIRERDYVICGVTLPTSTPSRGLQYAWTTVGCVGMAASVAAVAYRTATALALTGMACTVLYVGRCCLYHNRGMLSYSLWSFDFLFLATQVHFAHVLLCHLLQWDFTTCLPVMASALWMHWVVTLALLTPMTKQRLGLHVTLVASLVLALELVGHVVLVVEILFRRAWAIDDLVLLRVTLLGNTVELHAVPLLLSRMATTLCWCLRLLWRLQVRARTTNELLLIYGAVEYDDHETRRRLREASPSHTTTSTHLSPVTLNGSTVPTKQQPDMR